MCDKLGWPVQQSCSSGRSSWVEPMQYGRGMRSCRACAQLQRDMPISLVLGLGSSSALLDQLLPLAACEALSLHTFPLTQVSDDPRAPVLQLLPLSACSR